MCPVPPLLSADSSDESVVMFLDSRSVDDPVPTNVITDVDPFTIDPRLSSVCGLQEESGTDGENRESKLPILVNQQERNSSLKQPENEFQGSNGIEGQLELPKDLMNGEAGLEDYIELKDLFDPEDGNSSFSGNTSVRSMTSDENFETEVMGFDPEAMISEIANDVNDANASVSSDPVVIQPPLSLVPGVMGKSKSEVSTSSSSESGGDGASAKHSGNGSSSYKRVKSRSARRMAKLGKRYCCFI